MNIVASLINQYHASLAMLGTCIKQCPDALWDDSNYTNKFWHVAYHILFFAQLYLYEDEKSFERWDKWKKNYQFMGALPWPPHDTPVIDEAYGKDDLLDYLELCKKEIAGKVPEMNLEKPSGFEWIPCNQFELQLYNIRHIQHHTGQLSERLRIAGNIAVTWQGL